MVKKKPAGKKVAGGNPSKWPKGLLEFYGSLSDGDYAPELLKRLTELPDKSIAEGVFRYEEAAIAADRAEVFARDCRARAKDVAATTFLYAAEKFTVKQLQKATGYTDE